MTMTISRPGLVAEDLGRRLAARVVNCPREPKLPDTWPLLSADEREAFRAALVGYLARVARQPDVPVYEARAHRARVVLRMAER